MCRHQIRDKTTCIHEAGHAVTCWLLGCRFQSISVLSYEQVSAGETAGSSTEIARFAARLEGVVADIEPPIFSKKEIKNNTKDYTPRQKYLFFQRNRTTVKIYLTILSAGATAESRYTEKPFESCLGTGGALDCEYMRKYSNDAFRSGETRAQALRQAIERSAALIQSPLCWRAISDISNAVSDGGKLSFDEADALCRDIYGRERPTIELVRRDWKSSVELINSGNWPP